MPEIPKEKILRIGVIQEGKIIEEKLIRKRSAVTIGSSNRNLIVLPSAAAPKSFSLFEVKGNDYYLVFTDDMMGRISVGDQAADLQSLKAQNLVKKVGNDYLLKLSDASRGRVAMGECIILFQFVSPPPEPVRPQLPPAVRGYWMRNLDMPYFTCLGGLMAMALVLIIWTRTIPIPEDQEISMEEIAGRFLDPDEIKKIDEGEKGAGGREDEVKPKKNKNNNEDQGNNEGDGKGPKGMTAAATRAAMERKVSGRGLLKILGAEGEGGIAMGGAVNDVFAEGGIEGTGDGAFEGIGGLDIATSSGQRGQRGMSGAGEAASIENMGTRGVVGGAGDGSKGKSEAKVVARITSDASLQEIDSDSRKSQDIVNLIRRRIGGIKSCYERRLKRDPELQGKVVIRFVIHPGGRVIEAEVVENTTGDRELAACIASQVKAIRFPPAQGSDTSVTYPFILAPGG